MQKNQVNCQINSAPDKASLLSLIPFDADVPLVDPEADRRVGRLNPLPHIRQQPFPWRQGYQVDECYV